MAEPELDDLVEPQLLDHLMNQATRLTRNSADAKDLLQDTIERGIRNRHRCAYGSLGVWLARVMHNLFIDRCRRKKFCQLVTDVQDLPINDAAEEAAPLWTQVSDEMLHAAVQALDEASRDLFLRHEVDGWSYAQIAEALGVPVPTVGTRLFRARQKIRAYLLREFTQLRGASNE